MILEGCDETHHNGVPELHRQEFSYFAGVSDSLVQYNTPKRDVGGTPHFKLCSALEGCLETFTLSGTPFLQPHRIEYDCVCNTGCHPVCYFFEHQSAGLGRSALGSTVIY